MNRRHSLPCGFAALPLERCAAGSLSSGKSYFRHQKARENDFVLNVSLRKRFSSKTQIVVIFRDCSSWEKSRVTQALAYISRGQISCLAPCIAILASAEGSRPVFAEFWSVGCHLTSFEVSLRCLSFIKPQYKLPHTISTISTFGILGLLVKVIMPW
jgi:hypothetical protein